MRNVRRLPSAIVTVLAAWFAITGQIDWPQAAAGATVAVLTLALVLFDMRRSGVRPRMPDGWWRGLRGLPRDVARDTITVGGEVLRRALRRPGRDGLLLVDVDGRDRYEVMVAIMGASATPNTVVVGDVPEKRAVMIHQLRVSEAPDFDVYDRLP